MSWTSIHCRFVFRCVAYNWPTHFNLWELSVALSRRKFFAGLVASLAAPAIVSPDSLMRLRGIIMPYQYHLAQGITITSELIIEPSVLELFQKRMMEAMTRHFYGDYQESNGLNLLDLQ